MIVRSADGQPVQVVPCAAGGWLVLWPRAEHRTVHFPERADAVAFVRNGRVRRSGH